MVTGTTMSPSGCSETCCAKPASTRAPDRHQGVKRHLRRDLLVDDGLR
jgi:hypothetical protein